MNISQSAALSNDIKQMFSNVDVDVDEDILKKRREHFTIFNCSVSSEEALLLYILKTARYIWK